MTELERLQDLMNYVEDRLSHARFEKKISGRADTTGFTAFTRGKIMALEGVRVMIEIEIEHLLKQEKEGENNYIYLCYDEAMESVEDIIKHVEQHPEFNINYNFDHIEHSDGTVDILLNWKDTKKERKDESNN